MPQRAPAAQRDPCVVETPPLTEAVSRFVRQWDTERPTTVGQFQADGRVDVSCISGVSWLVQETKLSRRTIQRIAAGQRATTELYVADRLINAIGAEHIWHTLAIHGNPRAPREQRSQCCGGSESLNGSAALPA